MSEGQEEGTVIGTWRESLGETLLLRAENFGQKKQPPQGNLSKNSGMKHLDLTLLTDSDLLIMFIIGHWRDNPEQ